MTAAAAGKRHLPLLVAVVAIVVVIGAGVWWLRGFLDKPVETPKQIVQEVRIVRPPPPPEEPPPPPPPLEEEVGLPEPEAMPEPTPSNEPPPGNQLGIDAEGSGSGDGFGLLGRPGGRDLLATGGSVFAWYGGLVKDEVLERLGDDPEVRKGSYSIAIRVWVRHDGEIERASLVGTSGDAERDRAIERALRSARLSQPPPANMPQPINLRIVSRA